MFNKSLWFILLTILGGFLFSNSANADFYRCSASDNSYSQGINATGLSAACMGVFGSGADRIIGDSTGGAFCGEDAETIGTCNWVSANDKDTAPPPRFDSDGYCTEDSTAEICQNPMHDDNDDGVPNFADPEHPAYDPTYCETNPSNSYCQGDDSGGGDDGSGGGDDGGGDSGGGGLPSNCEGSPTFSETCCREHAEAQCLDSGGLADWGLVSIGSPTCNYTCNNDGDNGSDPGDDGGSGDDGSGDQTDNSDVVNAINQLKDSNITEFGQFKDALDSLVTQTSQQTDDLVAAQQNNTDTLSNDLSTLNETNQTGFEALSSQLEAIKNNTAQDSPTNPFLADIAENTSKTNELLEKANEQYFSQNGALMGIESEIMANGDTLGDISGQLGDISDGFNTDKPLPTDSDFGSGDFGGAAAGSGIGDALNDRFGDMPGIPNKVVNLSEGSDKFKPILPDVDSACPEPMQMDFGVTRVSLGWGPFCDLFSLLGILVIASASLAVPFIILGVSKK
ncbi:virulence factor TspB C-terminal domain-related protein [Idiomarina loihiensis]|uniref:virulence factor TspB C-terminal domain-related protein n=1 Tax=Idiomarina loihiensis TaxID=135577 RepID=UPI00315815A7